MSTPGAFAPSGIITLTTDFGLADPFVGVMKGRILSRFAVARIVDLTHEIPAHQPQVAGFWLARCFEDFPAGTVHVAVVDPGVGTDRAIVCLLARGHALLAPDNGLLEPCRARDPRSEIVELAPAALAALHIHRVSSTFHGRDIFAPVAAELAAGRCPPAALGPRRERLAAVDAAVHSPAPHSAAVLIGSVVTIDRFGNLITDLDAERLKGIAAPRVCIAGRGLPLRRTYGEAHAGELLALVNAFGVLEIAEAHGSAAATLGVKPGTQVTVEEGEEHLLGGANRL